MYHLPLEVIKIIYSFDDNVIQKKNKNLCILDLKSKFGYYKKLFEACLCDIIYEYHLYINIFLKKYESLKLPFCKYILLRNISSIRRLKKGDKSILQHREQYRQSKYLPKRAVLVFN
tara:strand:- start:1634 stop:1984 length:351 start_codon:yes stop_codon:yes gene_type:complete